MSLLCLEKKEYGLSIMSKQENITRLESGGWSSYVKAVDHNKEFESDDELDYQTFMFVNCNLFLTSKFKI